MLLLSASGVHYSMLNTGGNTGWFARKQQGAKTTLRTVSRTRANLEGKGKSVGSGNHTMQIVHESMLFQNRQ